MAANTFAEKRVDKFVSDAIVVEPMVANNIPSQTVTREKKRLRTEARAIAKKKDCLDYMHSNIFFGASCLNNAVKRGFFYLAELLLKEVKINPNHCSEWIGKTALHYATEYSGQNQELFKRLITEYRANVNAVDLNSTSVLHLAVYNNKPEQVKFLLESGATAGNATFFGHPIHIAALYGRVEMVKEIITKYPSELNISYQGYHPVQCSIYAESSDCLNLLSATCRLDIPILYKVISSKRTDGEALPVIQLLLNRGANANFYDANMGEELPILAAARKGWESSVDAMLHHTVPIARVDDWSVQGLLSFVEQDVGTESRVQLIKTKIIRELQSKQLLSASCLIKSVQYEMENVEWDLYDSFGKLMRSMGMCTSHLPETDAAAIFVWGKIYIGANDMHLAQLVQKTLQLLNPSLSDEFSELLEGQGSGQSGPSTSRRA